MTDIFPAQYIRIDLFPANVRSTAHGSEVLSPVRIIVTDAHVYIFKDSANGPTLIYSAVLDSMTGDNKVGYTVLTEDNQTLEFRRSTSCGCGSKLRGYRPFPGVPYSAR